jgi:hypothetical protein
MLWHSTVKHFPVQGAVAGLGFVGPFSTSVEAARSAGRSRRCRAGRAAPPAPFPRPLNPSTTAGLTAFSQVVHQPLGHRHDRLGVACAVNVANDGCDATAEETATFSMTMCGIDAVPGDSVTVVRTGCGAEDDVERVPHQDRRGRSGF